MGKPNSLDKKKELEYLLRSFPNKPFHYDKYGTWNKSFAIALILYYSGAKTVKRTVSFCGGAKDRPECVMVHDSSIEVNPYLPPPVKITSQFEGTNLLWYLLKKANIPYSGGAGEDSNYMQACSHGKENDGILGNVEKYFLAISNSFK